MTKEERKEYLEKMQAKLQGWNKIMGTYNASIDQAEAKNNPEFEDFRRQQEEVKDLFEKMHQIDENDWQNYQSELDRRANDLDLKFAQISAQSQA